MNSEYLKEMGFDSEQEFMEMVASLNTTTVEARDTFKQWQYEDGTKNGLQSLVARYA